VEPPAIALELLKDEHAHVDRLLGELAAHSGDLELTRRTLSDELDRHMRLEEQVFYPALERLETLASFVARLRDQHARMREAMQFLLTADVGDRDGFAAAVAHLNALFDAHVVEEQGRAFAYAREHLGDELDGIAVEMEHCREALRGAFGVG
jgi:hemerythrin-like domain-containing protein